MDITKDSMLAVDNSLFSAKGDLFAIKEGLFAIKDEKYAAFVAKLVPNIARDSIIGCRAVPLKTLAKQTAKQPYAARFLKQLPHRYYEENILHGSLIALLHKDISDVLISINEFLPYIDNWAVCDGTVCGIKILGRHPKEVLQEVEKWLDSGKTYTVRFGVVTMLSYFLDDNFDAHFARKLCGIESGDYYIDMAVAWYFCTALTKKYNDVVPIIQQRLLPTWTHNKAIQKACESYRIDEDKKAYLRSQKIKQIKR